MTREEALSARGPSSTCGVETSVGDDVVTVRWNAEWPPGCVRTGSAAWCGASRRARGSALPREPLQPELRRERDASRGSPGGHVLGENATDDLQVRRAMENRLNPSRIPGRAGPLPARPRRGGPARPRRQAFGAKDQVIHTTRSAFLAEVLTAVKDTAFPLLAAGIEAAGRLPTTRWPLREYAAGSAPPPGGPRRWHRLSPGHCPA